MSGCLSAAVKLLMRSKFGKPSGGDGGSRCWSIAADQDMGLVEVLLLQADLSLHILLLHRDLQLYGAHNGVAGGQK